MSLRIPGFLAVALLSGTASAPALAGQGALVDARLEAVLPSGAGPVELVLEFTVAPETGTPGIPLTVLTPGRAKVRDLRVGREGGVALGLIEERPGYWIGSIPLTAGPGSGGTEAVILSYTVEGGWEESGRITLPIPVPMWAPRDPQLSTFTATLLIPMGFSVTESFPTSVTERPVAAEGGAYRMALQSIPSMLVLRVKSGPPPLLTWGRILDGVVVLLLLVMGVLGVVYLRGRGG